MGKVSCLGFRVLASGSTGLGFFGVWGLYVQGLALTIQIVVLAVGGGA